MGAGISGDMELMNGFSFLVIIAEKSEKCKENRPIETNLWDLWRANIINILTYYHNCFDYLLLIEMPNRLTSSILCMRRGGEMADAPALGAGGSNPMEVRVLSPAPFDSPPFGRASLKANHLKNPHGESNDPERAQRVEGPSNHLLSRQSRRRGHIGIY